MKTIAAFFLLAGLAYAGDQTPLAPPPPAKAKDAAELESALGTPDAFDDLSSKCRAAKAQFNAAANDEKSAKDAQDAIVANAKAALELATNKAQKVLNDATATRTSTMAGITSHRSDAEKAWKQAAKALREELDKVAPPENTVSLTAEFQAEKAERCKDGKCLPLATTEAKGPPPDVQHHKWNIVLVSRKVGCPLCDEEKLLLPEIRQWGGDAFWEVDADTAEGQKYNVSSLPGWVLIRADNRLSKWTGVTALASLKNLVGE